MSRKLARSHAYFQRAKEVIPLGVNSNFRYWGENETLTIQRGEGAHLWDVDGNRYIDYRLGFGPIILGHAYPAVVDRVTAAIRNGTVFALSNIWEINLAERIIRLTHMDKVRLCNTGTEATMHALRIAWGHTGRERIIKFEGQYHGMHDYLMYSTASTPVQLLGPRNAAKRVPSSLGIPQGIEEYLISLPYNDEEVLVETMNRWGEEVAAIIVEPLLGNAAGILPDLSWLRSIRTLCDMYGSVLIFDEVKTGFRVALGGAQEYFQVKADLATYAKALGNGFPVAAVAGNDAVMSVIRPGKVLHGGTYTGNVVAAAAADATLEIMESEPVLETIFARGRQLMNGLDEILNQYDIPHVVTGIPSIFGLMLGSDSEPRDVRQYAASDTKLYNRIAWSLIHHGVMPDMDGREPWFLCYSHSEQDIWETLTIFEETVKSVKAR